MAEHESRSWLPSRLDRIEEGMRRHENQDEERFRRVNSTLAGLAVQPPLAVRLDRLEVMAKEREKRDDKANAMLRGLVGGMLLVVAEALFRLITNR